MRILVAAGFAVLAALASPLGAQQPTGVERAWNELARADVAAALQLIEVNHPGATAALGDTGFQDLLRTARANAERRLPLVKDYYGHAALLNGKSVRLSCRQDCELFRRCKRSRWGQAIMGHMVRRCPIPL